jgi:class 3 adenylate cyclase/tetratricopeptide (TPR) repeat protein
MICSGCGSSVDEASRFCPNCGTFVGHTCPACKAAAAANAWFCQHCGTTIRAKTPAISAPEGGAHHQGSFPRGVAGERKRVTMIFADLVGSMELLANIDAEEARRLLESVVERMIAVVTEFGGVVNQVSGDGIMALFGAPSAIEDHALRACHAALRMQVVIKAQSFAEAHERPVQIRVGIHSGEVVVAERGYGSDHQYTAFGRAAHVSARMQQMARPGHILISSSTQALVADNVYAENAGMLPVKGLAEPVQAFELRGALLSHRMSPNRGIGAPFIGRTALVKKLRTLASHAQSTDGHAVIITGEPGSGKSRLCSEVLGELGSDYLVLKTGGISFVRPPPYQSIVAWLQPCFATTEPLDHSIRTWLRSIDPEALEYAPALLALFGSNKEDADWAVLPPSVRRERIENAVIQVLTLEAARRPLALLIEDLQWVDNATISLLSVLIQSITKTRIFLLATARSEGIAPVINQIPATVIALDNFTEDETKEFLDVVLGPDQSLEHLKTQMFHRTAGNVFFLEETIKSLQSFGALIGTMGSYALTELSDIEIPGTVQDLLAVRIDRLPPRAKEALQAAAIFGTEFNPDHLARLIELDQDRGAILQQLSQANFVVEGAGAWGRHLAFRHALSREVAYSGMLHENRHRLHARALQILEEDSDVEPSILAHHARCGEVWDKEYRYSRSAGEISLSRSAPQEALRCFEEALGALAKLPPSDAVLRAELDLRFLFRNSLFLLGRARSIGEHLASAETLARRLGDDHGLAKALCQRAHYSWQIAEWDNALGIGEAALKMSDKIGNIGLKVSTNFYMGLANHALGNYADAANLLARNVATLSGDLARERFGAVSICSVVSGSYLVICLAELGQMDEAAAAAERACSIANEAGGPFDRIQANLATAAADLIRGEAARRIPLLENTLALCKSASVAVLLPRTVAALALAYAQAGRMAEALELTAERGEKSGEAVRAMSLLASGQALLIAGQVTEAASRADILNQHCDATNQAGAKAWALHLLASARAVQGSWRESETLLQVAVALAKPRGMLPLLARCGSLHAAVARSLGDESRALHLAKAAAVECLVLGLKPMFNIPLLDPTKDDCEAPAQLGQ